MGRGDRKPTAQDVALDQGKTTRVVARWSSIGELGRSAATIAKALASVLAPVLTADKLKEGRAEFPVLAVIGTVVFVAGALAALKIHRDRNEKQRMRGRIDSLEEENRKLAAQVNQSKGELRALRAGRPRGGRG